jgi:hypothetical protein
MTIAIGVVASDGIVVAADSQLTTGESKYQHGKLRAQVNSGWDGGLPGACIVTGAASHDTYLYECMARLQRVFGENKTAVGNALRAAFTDELVRFHSEHIMTFAAYQPQERPDVDMLLAYERNGIGELLYSDNTVLVSSSSYAAVGSGNAQAYAALARMFRLPLLDVWETVLLAAYVVYSVKASSIYCGMATNICVIKNNNFIYLNRDICRRLDDAMDRYSRHVEADTLRHAIGASDEVPSDPESAQLFADILRDLRGESR